VAKVASAKRHAQAVFKIALEKNEVEKWRSELKTVASILGDPQILAILENPKIHFGEKKSLVDKCLAGLSTLTINFAYFMVERQRLPILSNVVEEFESMADAHQGLEHARVTTAISVDDKEKNVLSDRLAAMTQKKVILTTEVDPAILGGFVARIGDKLIDGSTRAKLEALKAKLLTQV